MRTFIVETKGRVYRVGVPDDCIIAVGVAQSGNTVENVWQVTRRLGTDGVDGHVPVEPCVSIPQVIAFREVGLCNIEIMEVGNLGEEKWVADPDGAVIRSQMRVNEVASAMKKSRNRNEYGEFTR